MLIRLFCNVGMSTSVLVEKMNAAAREKGKNDQVESYAISELVDYAKGSDIVLLGPQVGFKLEDSRKICEPLGIPCEVIPSKEYGMVDGMAVLKFAHMTVKKYKKDNGG